MKFWTILSVGAVVIAGTLFAASAAYKAKLYKDLFDRQTTNGLGEEVLRLRGRLYWLLTSAILRMGNRSPLGLPTKFLAFRTKA